MTVGVPVILFLTALLGGLAVFIVKRNNPDTLKLILSFSGAYLFSITVLHLIPEVYENSDPTQRIGLYVLGGFLFQLLLERFSEGIEHGHIHTHPEKSFPIGIMISLCLHAFMEGMPLARGPQKELLFGIALHHIPASFALGTLLLKSSTPRKYIIVSLFFFALMSPLGFLTSELISNGNIGVGIEKYFSRMMAIVIGIFLHISTTILFESSSSDHHHFNKQKLTAVLLGVSLSLINFLFH